MSTNLHIDDIGNLILRDGKLGLFVSSQYVTPPHYGGGRVGALSPYAYCAGDPVNCVDPDGRDAQYIVNGNNITINVGLVISGQYANNQISADIKTSLQNSWGAVDSYSYNGQEYSIKWNISVSYQEKQNDKGLVNYMEYNPGRKNSNANKASYVRGNRVGVLYNLDHVVHEFGHMIGCSDKYYYNDEHQGIPMPGKEDDIMSGSGKPSSQTIAPVLDNFLNDHNSSIWNRIKDFLGISTIYNVNNDDYSEPNTDTHKENKPK